MDHQSLLARITAQVPDALIESAEFRGDLSLVVRPERYLELARWLRDEPDLGYTFLENLCGVDYLGRDPRFEVVVHLVSMQHLHRVCLKLRLPEAEPRAPSLTALFPTANYQEREAYDLLGISFDGHPSLTRILLPDDWVGHPQRKDHPLVEEEIAFSFNQERIYAHKPFAKE